VRARRELPAEQKRFWRYLLDNRHEVSWASFEWFSPSSLLSAFNDQVAKAIEEPGESGSIVDQRRMRWMAQQRSRAGAPSVEVPLRIPDSQGVVILGDPGEMDGSQYVWAKTLSMSRDHFAGQRIGTALLMSDIVYPAGDVNQWADAVYLPYFGEPQVAWDSASRETGCDLAPPFAGWSVLAIPGNHDWYDGLSGFMFHACGAEPLPEVTYDAGASSTWRQRLTKRVWRNPAEPKRELVQDLRDRRVRPDTVGIPRLPGPYFAADLGCAGPEGHVEPPPGPEPRPEHLPSCVPALRVVGVDTGITGTVDVEQARWLARLLDTADPLPTIIVTGVPLAAGNSLKALPVAADPEVEPTLGRDLHEIVARATANIVATVAGDTHNYQRMVFGPDHRPPLQVVAGGGGAYLSKTHGIEIDPQGRLPLTPARGASAEGLTVPPGAFVHYPSRAHSLMHFASRNVGYLAVIAFVGLVAGAANVLLGLGMGSGSADGPVVAGSWLVLVCSVVLVAGNFALQRRADRGRLTFDQAMPVPVLAVIGALALQLTDDRDLTIVVSVAASALLVLVVLDPPIARRTQRFVAASGFLLLVSTLALISTVAPFLQLLAGAAFILALFLAQFVPSLFQSFSRLRDSWMVRALAIAGVVVLVQQSDLKGPRYVLVLVAVGLVTVMVVNQRYRHAVEQYARRRFTESDRWMPLKLGALQYAPFFLVMSALVVSTIVLPETILRRFDVADPEGVAATARALSLQTLLISTTGCGIAGAVLPLRKAVHALPVKGAVVFCVLAAAAALGAGWASGDQGTVEHWLLVGHGAVVGLLLAVPVCVLPVRRQRPEQDEVENLLRRLDGARTDHAARSFKLFSAAMVGHVPGVELIAEASEPPFAKNMLVVRASDDGRRTDFVAYGLNDECAETPSSSWTRPPDEAGDGPGRGLFVIDRVSVLRDRTVKYGPSWTGLWEPTHPGRVRSANGPAASRRPPGGGRA
jgi:hypothetical protein